MATKKTGQLELEVSSSRFPTRASRAKWLFEFRGLDFGSLTPGQLLDQRRSAFMFVGAAVMPQKGGLDTDRLPTVSALKMLQKELQEGLDKLWRGEESWRQRRPIKDSIARVGDYVVTEGREGSFLAVFVAAMMDVLRESWDRVRSCPQCGTPFFKVGKIKYCSTTCSRKYRWERYTEGLKAKGPRTRDYRAERERAAKNRKHQS